MAFLLNVRVSGTAPGVIQALEKRLVSEEVSATVESAAAAAWHDHMLANYVTRQNRLGGQSTDYWRDTEQSIDSAHSGPVVRLTMRQVGLALHYHGGTVRPSGRVSTVTGKPIKFLTIPAVAEAHGRTASDFGGRLSFRRDQGPGLYDTASGRLIFRLARKATIKPDPGLIPSGQYFGNRIKTALQALIDD